ncbi:MAG: metallophosphoesterase [Actinomycetota bacterium]
MKILAISDKVTDFLYSPVIKKKMGDISFVISCGDLPSCYLEFIVTMLNKPLFYVFGNHHKEKICKQNGIKKNIPQGCINLDNKIINYKGLLIGGLEGSMRYSRGKHQYSDFEMCLKINKLKPAMYINKLFKKRYIDILVTHAPPLGINDRKDLCHRGFKCFVSFIKRYKPRYLIHGHVHLYGIGSNRETIVNSTKVINAYGYQIIEI